MTIVSSEVNYVGGVERDGSRILRFVFTDHTGQVHSQFGCRKYPEKADPDTIRATLAARLEAVLASRERRAIWRMDGAAQLAAILAPEHQTTRAVASFLVRQIMRATEIEDIERCEEFVAYLRENYTAIQMRSLLDLTAPQVMRFLDKTNRVLVDTYPLLTAKQAREQIKASLEVEDIGE